VIFPRQTAEKPKLTKITSLTKKGKPESGRRLTESGMINKHPRRWPARIRHLIACLFLLAVVFIFQQFRRPLLLNSPEFGH
jgi:hypothetical protein